MSERLTDVQIEALADNTWHYSGASVGREQVIAAGTPIGRSEDVMVQLAKRVITLRRALFDAIAASATGEQEERP